MFEILVAVALGYLLGSIPSAALIARLRGRSIFEIGSGNMGAMNTARNLGFLLGIVVLGLDIGKGALATFLGQQLASTSGLSGTGALVPPLAAGLAAVLGHGWSVYIRFRGGKGLATTLGVGLPLYPIPALFGLVTLIGMVLILRRVNLASAITVGIYPFIVLFALRSRGEPQEVAFTIFSGVLLLGLIGVIKHIPGLRRRERPFF